MASSWEKSRENGPATIRQAQIAVSEVLGRLPFNTATFRGCYEARATGHHLQNRWKTDLVARRVLKWQKSEESAIYFTGQISCRLSLRFPPVFPLNAFQNIHKDVAIFLIQCSTLHYVICFFLRNIYINNHVIAEHHLHLQNIKLTGTLQHV